MSLLWGPPRSAKCLRQMKLEKKNNVDISIYLYIYICLIISSIPSLKSHLKNRCQTLTFIKMSISLSCSYLSSSEFRYDSNDYDSVKAPRTISLTAQACKHQRPLSIHQRFPVADVPCDCLDPESKRSVANPVHDENMKAKSQCST